MIKKAPQLRKEKAMKNINAIFYSVIMSSIFNISYASVGEGAAMVAAKGLEGVAQNMAKTITGAASMVGAEAVQTPVPVLDAVVCICALKDVAYMGNDLYQYCYPDEDKKERNRQAEEAIAIINTKRVFRTCLMKNAKGQRNKEDLPIACEECGDAFAAMAGTAAFEDMARLFKQAY